MAVGCSPCLSLVSRDECVCECWGISSLCKRTDSPMSGDALRCLGRSGVRNGPGEILLLTHKGGYTKMYKEVAKWNTHRWWIPVYLHFRRIT